LLQHQQQVAAAVERAKQITVQELNAIIGVCDVPLLMSQSSDLFRKKCAKLNFNYRLKVILTTEQYEACLGFIVDILSDKFSKN